MPDTAAKKNWLDELRDAVVALPDVVLSRYEIQRLSQALAAVMWEHCDCVPAARWIPVSEQLPEPGRLVIVPRGTPPVARLLRTPQGWVAWSDVTGMLFFKNAPTHWMPFPEPPTDADEQT